MASTEGGSLRSLDCRWLLALYALVPVSLLLVAVDRLFLEDWLRYRIPANPASWPFWTVIFGLPHIIASLLTMADRDYLDHYRKVLLRPTLVFAAIAAVGQFGPQPLSFQLLFMFAAVYTVYHVLAQQLGLALMMTGRPPDRTYLAWKWLSIVTAIGIYVMVYDQRLGAIRFGSVPLLRTLGYALCVMVTVLGVQLALRSRTRLGAWYVAGNVGLVVSTFVVMQAGYSLLVVLVPRVIHDVTAYMVYITHDTNRNRATPRNYLYRLMWFTRLPPVLLLPLVSGFIAYHLTASMYIGWVNVVVLTLSFLHYYFEGFIWRGTSPHRAWVEFRR